MLHFRTDKLVTIILLVLDIVKKKKKPRNIAPFDLIHASKRAWKFELRRTLCRNPSLYKNLNFVTLSPPQERGMMKRKSSFISFFFLYHKITEHIGKNFFCLNKVVF